MTTFHEVEVNRGRTGVQLNLKVQVRVGGVTGLADIANPVTLPQRGANGQVRGGAVLHVGEPHEVVVALKSCSTDNGVAPTAVVFVVGGAIVLVVRNAVARLGDGAVGRREHRLTKGRTAGLDEVIGVLLGTSVREGTVLALNHDPVLPRREGEEQERFGLGLDEGLREDGEDEGDGESHQCLLEAIQPVDLGGSHFVAPLRTFA